MMNGRNELFPDPFDEFDPHHTFRGKKAFMPGSTRCLQSFINLKMQQEDMVDPIRRKFPARQEFLQAFNKLCVKNYETNMNDKRYVNVGNNNPFKESNQPPEDYLIPEKILEKPGKIQNL